MVAPAFHRPAFRVQPFRVQPFRALPVFSALLVCRVRLFRALPVFRALLLMGTISLLVSACAGPDDQSGESASQFGETEVSVGFSLARDQAGLQEYVDSVSDPQSDSFREFLTVDEAAARFGATAETRQEALSTLAEAGVSGAIDPSGGLAFATMTAVEVEETFDTEMRVVAGSTGVDILEPVDPNVDPFLGSGAITSVIGLSSSVPIAPSADSAPRERTVFSADQPDCSQHSKGSMDAATFRERHGLPDPATANWRGVRLGFLSADPIDQRSLDVWAECTNADSVPAIETTLVNGSGGSTNPESVLDSTAMVAIAAGIEKVEMVQFDEASSILFPLARVVESSGLDILSISLVYCETSFRESEMDGVEWLLAVLAATGTSTVAASGDLGSQGCGVDEGAAVTYPASSPNVLAVGGTQLNPDDPAAVGTVWNRTGKGDVNASGGGTSTVFDSPWYQVSAATRTSGESQSNGDQSPVGRSDDGRAGGDRSRDGERADEGPEAVAGRTVPDLALLAEPEMIGSISVCNSSGDCYWDLVGGTSLSAPSVAGALALIQATAIPSATTQSTTPPATTRSTTARSTTTQATPRRSGDPAAGFERRMGLTTPLVYLSAATGRSGFSDVISGTNDLAGLGCCSAEVGYDLTTGWGTPLFGEVLRAVPSDD